MAEPNDRAQDTEHRRCLWRDCRHVCELCPSAGKAQRSVRGAADACVSGVSWESQEGPGGVSPGEGRASPAVGASALLPLPRGLPEAVGPVQRDQLPREQGAPGWPGPALRPQLRTLGCCCFWTGLAVMRHCPVTSECLCVHSGEGHTSHTWVHLCFLLGPHCGPSGSRKVCSPQRGRDSDLGFRTRADPTVRCGGRV